MLGRSDFPSALPFLVLRVPTFFFLTQSWVLSGLGFFFSPLSFSWSATSSNFFRKHVQVAYYMYVCVCVCVYIYIYIYESLSAAFKTQLDCSGHSITNSRNLLHCLQLLLVPRSLHLIWFTLKITWDFFLPNNPWQAWLSENRYEHFQYLLSPLQFFF